jgi:hypothetical protein
MEEEKQNLETQTEETTTTEETSSTEDTKVVEKDGEVYIRMDTDESDPKEEPEKGESSEDNQKVEGTSEDKPEAPTTDDEVDSLYANKSLDEVIGMHRDATRKISEQGAHIGDLKNQVTEVPTRDMTPEEILNKMSAEQVKGAYQEQKSKLSQMDQVMDEAAFMSQKSLVDSLEEDWLVKRQEEQIDERFNSQDNKEFIETAKAKFKETGVEMTDDEFSQVSKIAGDYLENGRYTDRSFQKALVDAFGVEKMTKFYAMKGEEKAREDISKASGKVENKIDVRGSGKNSKLRSIGNMKPHEMQKTFKDLTLEELDRLQATINK